MSTKRRVARLERRAGADEERRCNCPIEIVEVREGGPGPVNAPASRNAAGRTVCGKCGMPHRQGQIAYVEIRLARRDDEPAP